MSDFLAQERAAAKKASNAIKQNINSQHRRQFKTRSGKLTAAEVSAKFRKQALDRIVINIPHYAFKLHYGTDKSGETTDTNRSKTTVKSFTRKIKGKSVRISSFVRSSSSVKSHNKGIKYKAHNNLGLALSKSKPAIDELADSLAENRIVAVSSLISF